MSYTIHEILGTGRMFKLYFVVLVSFADTSRHCLILSVMVQLKVCRDDRGVDRKCMDRTGHLQRQHQLPTGSVLCREYDIRCAANSSGGRVQYRSNGDTSMIIIPCSTNKIKSRVNHAN